MKKLRTKNWHQQTERTQDYLRGLPLHSQDWNACSPSMSAPRRFGPSSGLIGFGRKSWRLRRDIRGEPK